jgi:hypothetical protein
MNRIDPYEYQDRFTRDMELDDLRKAIQSDMHTLFNALGMRKHGARYACPFPGCGSKSAFSGESGGIRCHKCGWAGDGLKLIMEIRSVPFPDALGYARSIYGIRESIKPKAEQRKKPMLEMDTGTRQERLAVANLRNVNIDAVSLTIARGLLRFATFDKQRCWIITDKTGRNMQARRVDGLPLQAGGRDIKAKTVPGSTGAWPIGTEESRAFPCIALVEGSADVLAAHHFMLCENMEHCVAVVGMMGSTNTIPEDALPAFVNKRVRIFPDEDEAGNKACLKWFKQLRKAGAKVDYFSLDECPNVKDLNDLTSVDPDTFEKHRELWSMMNINGGE